MIGLKYSGKRISGQASGDDKKAVIDALFEECPGVNTSEYGRSILMTFQDRPVDLLCFDKSIHPEMTI